MKNKENILNELEQISKAVATISNRNVYSVPTGYFDTLAEEVLARVQMAPLQVLRVPYSVPEGYFDNLAGSVMARIKAEKKLSSNSEVFEELEEIAPLLNTISKQMPYSVPVGYFQQFSVNVEIAAPVAQVVSMNSGSSKKWRTYLLAACVTALLGIGAFWFTQHNPVNPPAAINVEKALASLSDDDINNYLNSDPSTSAEALPSSLEEQAPDVQPFIENMSNEEIQQYLKENSGPDEKSKKDI